ncbi:Alpha/beta hydrolase family protein [Rhodobacteraceae bacterium THAF1]|uniref:bifunctional alpha/beta hydrolase/OsmC family protein n=1 Tax=Palleronia sp. THAF1 TaxID=2587842 RepID=UPI000F3BA487|nr:bifunctional alpha/beta hydrolase/OsmC family protein [Palleronia sp. THAF1]QFU09149.1 Alpha/beta hydrolase family protein [Palleronia sp. THAF1]VDC24043.1 Alpha/beta hydrolase family protein [Rhodobacteraceae bacterium THAF1]
MATERLDFTSNGKVLDARLDRPAGRVRATALFAHCFTCGKDIAAARRIAARLAAQGIAVLRFDFTGLGRSEGSFEETTFASNVDDLVAAADALEQAEAPPSLLIGHSLGGAAILKAAARLPSAKAVATIGAPFDPGHVTHNFGDALDRIEADGVAEVNLGGRPVRIGRDFVRDVDGTDLAPTVANLSRALLVLHAPRDQIVGIDNATAIFLAATHPKSFVTLDSADHLISRVADSDYAADVIAAWSARYLDLPPEPQVDPTPEGVVRTTHAEGFLHDITTPDHHIQADEPLSVGGTNLGMTPYQLLGAGLGACTSMTLKMYADRKGIALTGVTVDVSHAKAHKADAETDADAKADVLSRTITLEGDLTEAERDKLMEIADKCPVHRTLEAGARIETKLA